MGKATQRKERPLVQPLDGPTPEQMARGTYDREDFIHADLGQRVTAHVNRGGTPIARWIAEDKLSDNQQRAIAHCLYLWRMTERPQRVTASYGERIPGSGDSEFRAANEIEAREDLHRIKGYIPNTWWDVFENVVRFDEPAGVAGGKLGYGSRTASERAHTVVAFVSDIVFERERL